MFAKVAEFRLLGGHVQRLRTAAKYDPARRTDCRPMAGARRARRPILMCRWHVVPSTGKLECRWQSVSAATIDESGQRRQVVRTRRLARARTTGHP
jgi:hypothetical protein